MRYYCEETETTLNELSTTAEGLSSEEAARRLEANGKNRLADAPGKSLIRRFLEQMADPMIIILLVAALISGVLAVVENESFADVIIILAVVIVNAVLGVYQENKAEKAIEAGAAGIVVSNHGGRVLDDCPATQEVLADIVAAVDGRAKILVDGGIRTGSDVFKALALGADAVLIARPFVTAVYGAGADGVAAYTAQLGNELADTMRLCGAPTLDAITRDMVRVIK